MSFSPYQLGTNESQSSIAGPRNAVGAATTFAAALLKRELTLAKLKQCFYATAESSAMMTFMA